MNGGHLVHRLRFFVTDAWDEWRHSPGVNLLALATLASSLFLAGLVMLVIGNLSSRVDDLRREVRVEVYLRDGVTDDARFEIESRLTTLDGVQKVEYVDKEEALRRYREWAGEMAELADELDTNPLPASYEVFLRPDGGVDNLIVELHRRLDDRPGVEEVRFNRDWLRKLEALLDLARVGGTILALLVFAAVAFVMASVLRLAVYARRDEIDIMLLVGATPAFVRGPFLVAGFVQGLLSSGLALLLVEGVRRAAQAWAAADSLVLLDLVAERPVTGGMAGLLALVGLTVSLLGSYFAVRRSV
jgi:cell division transport system permease protein